MNHTITNAAGITILEPLDNNFKTGGGPVSIGGCVVVASKGKPFVPLEIQPESTWSGGKTSLEQILGSPLSKKAYGMEGLRQLSDACKECSWVNAVRVVSTKGYRYPSLAFLMFRDLKTAWATDTSYKPGDLVTDADKQWVCAVAHVASAANKPGTEPGEWLPFSGPVETAAHRYNEEVLVGDDGFWMVFYPIDGCDCQKRTVRIEDVDTARQRFTLSIYEKDDAGYESLLEGYEVGIGEDDKDDMGRPAYIETVFETRSSHFRCDFLEGTAWEDLEPILLSLEWKKSTPQLFSFSGGTDGGVPELADWLQATSVFSNEQVQVNLLFAAGNVEPDFIAKQAEIADGRHISYFFDVPPYLSPSQALEWVKELGLKSRHARCYYSALEANDPWRGGKAVWGVSGAMAAAKARGNATYTKNVPGVHYSPAGQKRGYLSRTGVKQLFPDENINRDSFHDQRINPIIPMASGGACADDDMVQHYESNYLRFGWINDVLDYIDHRFLEAASQVKFEPDGLTQEALYEQTKTIMDELVISGGLVTPRDPENDGISPYIVTVTQVEIDLWQVEWAVCITGSARRIAGQPRLIR